jgi:hypothetical protein
MWLNGYDYYYYYYVYITHQKVIFEITKYVYYYFLLKFQLIYLDFVLKILTF